MTQNKPRHFEGVKFVAGRGYLPDHDPLVYADGRRHGETETMRVFRTGMIEDYKLDDPIPPEVLWPIRKLLPRR